MCDLQQKTHSDWTDLDDMNNLADTKGGNINAHIYSNLFCRWCIVSVFPATSLMWKSSRCPQCWINPEMYQRLRVIHIQMHDNDSQINPWQELLPLCALKVTFFPPDLYLDSILISQLIPWYTATPERRFLPPACHPESLRSCKTGNMLGTFALCSSYNTRYQD